MKKKIILFMVLALSIFTLTACKKATTFNLNDYLIEERNTLYTASDDLYCATLTSGYREQNYNFDGEITPKVEFGALNFSRLNKNPMATDTYTYLVTVGEQTYTGFLTKGLDNSYSADIESFVANDQEVKIEITFTGYNFSQTMTNTSSNFSVDSTTALKIANDNLSGEIQNLTKNKNNKVEVVMKILNDYTSTEEYFWYVGIVSTNGETYGILINANSGEVVAKKV